MTALHHGFAWCRFFNEGQWLIVPQIWILASQKGFVKLYLSFPKNMGVGKIMQLNLATMFMIDFPSVHLQCAVYKKIPNIRYLTSLGCFSSFTATPQVYFDRVCRESALLFHILCTFFPFFFLIENLCNIYLNVIFIFFISRLLVIEYFLRDHPCFKEIQINSATEILYQWTRFPWPRQYLSTVYLNFFEAWMITHAGNKSTALSMDIFQKII